MNDQSGLTQRESENFFYSVQMLDYRLSRRGDEGYDPTSAWIKCLEVAKQFEQQYADTDWDEVPTGYWGTIDEFMSEALEDWFDTFQPEQADEARRNLMRWKE